MIPSTESVALFDRNVSFFRLDSPDISEIIDKHPVDPARLIQVGDDDWDVLVEGEKRLYGQGARAYSNAHVDSFWTHIDRQRLCLTPPHTTDISGDAHATEFMRTILERAVESGVQFYERRCDNSAANVVVFGIGLAQHLPLLAKRSECESVIIIEPSADLFLLSLYTFDWRGFIENLRTKDGDARIFLTADTSFAAYSIMGLLNDRYPPLIDGTLFYRHYDSPVLDETNREFATNYASQVATGFGFVEDDLLMITNSVRNLENFEGHTFRQGIAAMTLPAFIVGSGPSFDRTVDTVRKYADRAIIISCGTGLRLLLSHGIVPDVHAELENVPAAYDIIARGATEHDFRKTLLLATTTVDPRIPPMFDDTVFFFRDGPASYPLFNLGENSTVKNAHPLVSNLAMSFAREIGCPEIYLFGVDLGTRDAAVHHSKESPYTKGELVYPFPSTLRTEANFGGTVFSHVFYMQSKRVKEFEIRENGAGVAYFNCSDGARVEGIMPLKAEDVRIGAGDQAKHAVKAALLAAFMPYDNSVFIDQWPNRNVLGALDSFTDRLESTVSRCGTNYVEVMRLLRRLNGILSGKASPERSPEETLFRGSLSTAMATAYFYLARTGNTLDRNLLAMIVKEELQATVAKMSATIVERYAELGHSRPDAV